MKGTYFRWTKTLASTDLHADILGVGVDITAAPDAGLVYAAIPSGRGMDADTARMIGVRLIEAAALADNGRSIREQ